MSEWELRDPWFLLTAMLAPLVYWLAARSPAAVTYSTLRLVDRAPRSLRARLARLPAVLLAVATLALALALAGPRIGDSTTKVKREGIAICMVVDCSGSMRALDLSRPDERLTRLQAVKEVFHDFVTGEGGTGGRPDDLIGVVSFAQYADGICPLTPDHLNLLAILAELHIASGGEERMTAMGEGLALAVERLRENPALSRVAILLTDGVSNAGAISPLQAAELAARHGIKVYTIGAGTNGLAPIEVIDPFTRRKVLQRRAVEIDEKTLRAIAADTGGRYFRATDEGALREIVAEIDRLERSEVVEVRYLRYTERYGELVLSALSLIAAAALLSGTWLRRLP